MIFKNFAGQDWIRFNFVGPGLDSDWKHSQSAHLCCRAQISGLWNFSVQDPILMRKIWIRFKPELQNFWKSSVRSSPDPPMPNHVFYFALWAKKLLELFFLQPSTIGWMQNSSSSAFASWGKLNAAFFGTSNIWQGSVYFAIRGKSTAEVILPLGKHSWLNCSSGRESKLAWEQGFWHVIRNLKPNLNINRKPKPNTSTLNWKLNLHSKQPEFSGNLAWVDNWKKDKLGKYDVTK